MKYRLPGVVLFVIRRTSRWSAGKGSARDAQGARSGHASLTGDWTAFYSDGTNGNYDITYEVNFGGYQSYTISSGNSDDNGYGNFEYSPNITGDGSAKSFYALNTKNLAEFG